MSPNRRLLGLVPMTAALAATAAVPAAATRPATPAERAEMVPSFGYQMVDERCAAAVVSTAAGGALWARIDAIDPAPAGCESASRQHLVLHRDGRTVDPWATALYGVPGEPLRRCADFLIPDAVGADLRACARSPAGVRRDLRGRTTLSCWSSPLGKRLTHRRTPRTCVVKTDSGRSSYAFSLRNVRWTGWGRSTARGTGLVRAYSSGRPDGPARRRAFEVTSVVRQGKSRSYGSLRVAGYSSSRSVAAPTSRGPLR